MRRVEDMHAASVPPEVDPGLPILTADRRWTDLGLSVPVESIR
jgi:hypothetical protein